MAHALLVNAILSLFSKVATKYCDQRKSLVMDVESGQDVEILTNRVETRAKQQPWLSDTRHTVALKGRTLL